MDYIEFGRVIERATFGLALAVVAFAFLGIFTRDRRFVLASRNMMIIGGFAAVCAAVTLIGAFFDGAYELSYVFNYSERALAWPYKIAGLWAGLQGSILFWSAILGAIGSVLAWSFRKRGGDPSGRRLEPFVYIVFGCVQVFFLVVICFVKDPFELLPSHVIENLTGQGLATNGRPHDGSGLNPLLESYWMIIHPPSVYLGFILYTVPFAFGMAALIAGEFSSYWIRTTRRWIMVAWLFNTNGVILGGLWAYEVLGWGGYWAWDPVENASFLPWLTATAFLHSVMIQERRDMLRTWNSVLIAATFILSIFGTYLTRSGIVSSVHAFSSGDVGEWFFWFLMLLIFVSLFLIFFRMQHLRSANTVDSALSREGVFLLNNMVLCSIAAAIVVLTLWPKISNDFLHNPITVGVPVYNLVCTPLFALLLAFTAIGPTTGWVRTSWSRITRNLVGPAILAVPFAAATQWLAYDVIRGGPWDDPVGWSGHLYPTFVVCFLGWWILLALTWEFHRTVMATMKATGRPPVAATLRVVLGNNRRYGGYIVHAGLALIAIGVVNSSMYRVQDQIRVPDGGTTTVGPYDVRVDELAETPVSAYTSMKAQVRVSKAGTEIATLEPERRIYPVTPYNQNRQPYTQPAIERRPGEDLYIYFDHRDPGDDYVFTVYRNPLISVIWIGWLIMIAGGLFAAAPLGRRKVGLAE